MLGKATIYVLSTLQLILLCNAEYLVEYFRQCELAVSLILMLKLESRGYIWSDINFDAVDVMVIYYLTEHLLLFHIKMSMLVLKVA